MGKKGQFEIGETPETGEEACSTTQNQRGLPIDRQQQSYDVEQAELEIVERAREHATLRRNRGLGLDRAELRREAEQIGRRLDAVTLGTGVQESSYDARFGLHNVFEKMALVAGGPMVFVEDPNVIESFSEPEIFLSLPSFSDVQRQRTGRAATAARGPASDRMRWWQDSVASWPKRADFKRLAGIEATGEVSLANALRILKNNSFGRVLKPDQRNKISLAQRGVGLEPERKPGKPAKIEEMGEQTWNALRSASMADARFTRAIVYVGPGLAVFFDTNGEVLDLQHGALRPPVVVKQVSLPAQEALVQFREGIYYSLFRDRTLVLAPSRYDLPRGVGVSFQKTFAAEESFKLEGWRGGTAKGVAFVINDSYWSLEPPAERVIYAPGRIAQAHGQMLRRGYLLNELRKRHAELAARLSKSPAEELTALIWEFAAGAINPFPAPEDFAWTLQVYLVGKLASLGRANAAADIDVAARLLAYLYSEPLLTFLLSKGGRVKPGVSSHKPRAPRAPRSRGDKSAAGAPELSSTGGHGTTTDVGETVVPPRRQRRPKVEPDARTHSSDDLGNRENVRRDTGFSDSGRFDADPRARETKGKGKRAVGDTAVPRDQKDASPQQPRARAHRETKQLLADADEALEEAEYFWAHREAKDDVKTVAAGGESITVSGYSYQRARTEDFPQRKAPTNEPEAVYYVRRYEQLSGQPPPAGNDNVVRGDAAASHAEVKHRVHQIEDGTNTVTGVSQDMCGYCRSWHQRVARKLKQRIVVADPHFIRVFNSDGSVEIYDSRTKRLVRTVARGEAPAAGSNRGYYEGVDW